MNRKKMILIPALACMLGAACDKLDDDRIPPAAVRVAFNTVADWELYGVPGAGSYRYFIREERIPADYPYTSLTYTGFGGIMLVGAANGEPVAYDMACPVECKVNVRVAFDPSTNTAKCPKCHSEYDVLTNYGHPRSGEAADRGYGLKVYRVARGSQGEYMVIQP